MNDEDRLQAILRDMIARGTWQGGDEIEDLDEQTLGVLISRWTEWDGDRILRVAVAALDDANWHQAATHLEQLRIQWNAEIDAEIAASQAAISS